MADSFGKEATDDTTTPRWVKAFGIAAVVVIALVVVLSLAGDGRHDPSRHLSSSDSVPVAPSGDRK